MIWQKKFESVVGSRTPSIHERFFAAATKISTLICRVPLQILCRFRSPNTSNHGWIRTIDVPIAQRVTKEDSRFSISQTLNEKIPYALDGLDSFNNSKWTDSDSDQFKLTGTKRQATLKYPDMASKGGTFFLERYIRVEDVTIQSSSDAVDAMHTKIRERVGGPDGLAADTSSGLNSLLSGHEKSQAAPLWCG